MKFRVLLLLALSPAFAHAGALLQAARADDAAAAMKLLDGGADARDRSSDGTTALHWAAHNGDLALLQKLIKAGAEVNARNDYGSTPMQEAAIRGDAGLLAALLKAGADVESPNDEGETALMTVARTGNVEAAQVLVKAHAKVNATEQWRGQTALMWAAAQGNPDMVRFLLKSGAKPDIVSAEREWERRITAEPRKQARPPGGFTALLLAAREGCAPCARELLKGGANPDLSNPENISPLLEAILNARFDTARQLIEGGADVNRWDYWGRAPLYSAIDYNTTPRGGRPDRPSSDVAAPLEIAQLLLDRGANVNMQLKMFPPYRLQGPDRGADALLTTGSTPLLRAAKACDAPAAKLLLAHGALVDLHNNLQVTPLMVTAGVGWDYRDTRGRFRSEQQCIETAQLLLDAGANVNAANGNGETALQGAARFGWTQLARLLVAKGADVNAHEQGGATALDIAAGRAGRATEPGTSRPAAHPETVAALEQLGGKPGQIRPAGPGPGGSPPAR